MDTLLTSFKNHLADLVNVFRIADLFDIAIIAILTYVILAWFKKTTSRFVLIGIIIFGLIYTVARFFNMYLTEYVLQGFFAILLIAMVIIFQEDLRRFFERLAMWSVFKKEKSVVSSHPHVDILVNAVSSLAQKRQGALIVLKGDEYLDRHIEGGTELDGKVSQSLLESIFDPHSTGHDGAVVIEDGHVVKFGCHLPLSSNVQKIRNLGLRHTAALGLTERSDALCIVVSEEKGTITISREEALKKLSTPGQLRNVLEDFYREKTSDWEKKSWFQRITHNPLEKAIAILLACGLWFAFAYQTESIRRDFVVPIIYRNLPNYWVIEEPRFKEATATLAGSEQAFGLLNPENLKIVLDMSNVEEGKQDILLGANLLKHPSNLTLVGIRPNKIQLVAHNMIPIEVPIKVETSGTISPDLIVRNIEANPKAIKVMALPKDEKRLTILTEPIDLRSIITTSTLTPKVVLPPNVRLLDDKPPEVRVTIEIERKQQEKKR
ncbi:MAG: diadenylate cyclase CdaA [Deltaproteobacteria bacterium]|nr:diadenylate cyclase CdaA [Deltaproteobacteria bacterium]